MAEGEGFEPPDLSINGFQDRRLKPLGHPSVLLQAKNLTYFQTICQDVEKLTFGASFESQGLILRDNNGQLSRVHLYKHAVRQCEIGKSMSVRKSGYYGESEFFG